MVKDTTGDKPTKQILEETGQMSVHQLCWWTALQVVQKCLRTGKPKWLMGRLEVQYSARRGTQIKVEFARLNLRMESLAIKAVQLWNGLPESVNELPPEQWRKAASIWVKAKVPIRPE